MPEAKRPCLLLTEEEYLPVAIGFGHSDKRISGDLRLKDDSREVTLTRWLEAPVGKKGRRPMTPEEARRVQRLASVGALLKECGCAIRPTKCALAPLEERLAELGPVLKGAPAPSRRKATDPKQLSIPFSE